MHRLRLIGLNHTTAALEVRERLAMNEERQAQAVRAIVAEFPGVEAVIVSTCNRFELYVAHAQSPPHAEEMARAVATFTGCPAERFAGHLYDKAEREAVGHLFSVAASLDSMVLGETQIIGQVRQSYEAARAAGAVGAVLNPLFQRALAVGKQVHSETSLTEGRLSVASVAVEYAKRIFDSFEDKTVLCVGAGKMTTLVLRHFAELRPGTVLVATRDLQKAAALTQQFGGEPVSLDSLSQQLTRADVVITSTAASEPIITRAMFDALPRKRRNRAMFLIDLAVPRDVESAVGELDNVYLYNMDDLQQVVAKTMGQRHEAVAAARAIVQKHVDDFDGWLRQRELGPVIEQLYARSHAMAREELMRALPRLPALGEAEREQLEAMTRRIVNKLLHDPIHAMRHRDGTHGSTRQYLHAVEKMFKLGDSAKGEPRE